MPTGIVLSNEEPEEGETVAISTQISNNGEVNATNVSIILMVDDVQIGDIEIIPIIEPGTSIDYSINWVSIAGDHDIRIAIDPENSINEHTEENNNGTVTISVSTNPVDNSDDGTSWFFVRMVIAIMLIIAIVIILIFLIIKKKKDKMK